MKNSPIKGALLLEALALLFFFSCAFAVTIKSQHIQSYLIRQAKGTHLTLDAFSAAETLLAAKLEKISSKDGTYFDVFETPTTPDKIHAYCESSQLRPNAPALKTTYRYFRCVLTQGSKKRSPPSAFNKHLIDLWVQKK